MGESEDDGSYLYGRRRPVMSRRFWWHYRFDVALLGAYAISQLVLWQVTHDWTGLLTITAMVLLLIAIVVRSSSAYRIGYGMGLMVVPLAMAQPTPDDANELVRRSSELWDPSPLMVAHQMEIERLERDVNRGNPGP
jgi:hypothetical protein